MKNIILYLLSLIFLCSCNEPPNQPFEFSIIPKPNQQVKKEYLFEISKSTAISISNKLKGNTELQTYLSQNHFTNFNSNDAEIVIDVDESLDSDESYKLEISTNKISIKAKHGAGAFYAFQSLFQLLPIEFLLQKTADKWSVPCVTIEDSPRFTYRGLHLDVARHFFKVEEVKRYIDLMAYYKFNHLHWHLTEDQGWRIEIKKYPKLTKVGAWRDGTLIGHYNDKPQRFDGKKYGGFYTQRQIKDIVQYAAERFITIVPEIEMPGHAQAALAAYPELACHKNPLEVMQLWGISDNVYCPTEETFKFLENVLTEVIDLFPGKYIHIGGDECPKTQWKESTFCQNLIKQKGLKDEAGLQSYFINRIEQFLNSKGKQIIGWDEILEGGLAPNATVMSWRGTKGGIEAAKSQHNVIMTPTSHCYFDYYQSVHPDEPLAIGGFLPLEKVYHYNVIPEELNANEAKYILGGQANLWTEYIPDFDQLIYMAYPRAQALSEVLWSKSEDKNLEDFLKRLIVQYERFEVMGLKPAKHIYDIKANFKANGKGVTTTLETLAPNAEIRYELTGKDVSTESNLYKAPFEITKNTQIIAQAFVDGISHGRGIAQKVNMHLAAGKTIELLHAPSEAYSAGGTAAGINGIAGSKDRYGDAEWLGFSGKDFEAVIDLQSPTQVQSIQCNVFNGPGQWIYPPKKVEVWGGMSKTDLKSLGTIKTPQNDDKVIELKIPLDSQTIQFLKIKMDRFGIIPDGAQGAGNEAWLFVDEVEVY